MQGLPNINIKALVFGAAIAAGFTLFGWQFNDWLYPFAALGIIYAGYGQDSVIMGTIMGAMASTPIVLLFFEGYFGQPTGFFITETGILTVALVIILPEFSTIESFQLYKVTLLEDLTIPSY